MDINEYNDIMLTTTDNNFMAIYEQIPDEYIYEELIDDFINKSEDEYMFDLSDINDDILSLLTINKLKINHH